MLFIIYHVLALLVAAGIIFAAIKYFNGYKLYVIAAVGIICTYISYMKHPGEIWKTLVTAALFGYIFYYFKKRA